MPFRDDGGATSTQEGRGQQARLSAELTAGCLHSWSHEGRTNLRWGRASSNSCMVSKGPSPTPTMMMPSGKSLQGTYSHVKGS